MKQKQRNFLPLMLLLCVTALVIMTAALCFGGKSAEQAEFVPPDFDPSAVIGTPIDAGESWMQVYQEGMNFSAHVCGRVIVNDNSADIYFTNDESNDVWMKLRITDSEGNILGETGLIKPGEYVKSVIFDNVPNQGAEIKMKIMSYEPDTYYSAGAVTLNTTIGG